MKLEQIAIIYCKKEICVFADHFTKKDIKNGTKLCLICEHSVEE